MPITKADLEKAQEVKAIIEKNYRDHYTYHELAQMVNTNPTNLQAAFKIATGNNLYEYLSLVRIEKAKHLLENTELKIGIIAHKVGLDRSNLNKQFRKLTKSSPKKWREEQAKNVTLTLQPKSIQHANKQ